MATQHLNEEAIFHIARQIDAAELRATYLNQVCGSDADLLARIEALITVHEEDRRYLASPAADLAGTVAPPKQPGEQIGPYKLREQIGEGGMGVVYVAAQTEPIRRKVALKIIKPGLATNDVVARFEAERQTLAMMDHPNIARVFDGGATEAGQPYFVMELTQGPPINEYCDLRRANVRSRLEIFLKVCRAVHHAHQKGIIHRDLKPSNVLVPEIDGAAVPKVIDFGVAKAVDQKLTEQTVYTRFAQLMGTPLYMSPEQAGMGVVDIDTRSDVYSLGVLLYELLTGRTPFESERLKQAGYDEMRRIIREEPPRPPSAMVSTLQAADRSTVAECRGIDLRKLSNTLQGELDWLVMKALEKDRDRRYESASALADDIERYLGDLPVVARPPSTSYRFRKFVRRNRVLVGSLSVVLVSLTLGTVLATVGFLNAKEAEETAQRQLADTRVLADLLRNMVPGPEWQTNTLGQHHTVYKSIEKVLPSLKQRLQDHPAVEIEVRQIFGRAYTAAGDFDKAREQLNLALQLAEQEYGQEHQVVAAIHSHLADEVGWNNWGPLNYPTLLAHAEKANEIYESLGQEASRQAWFAKAHCLLAWPERWGEAEDAQRKCVELSRSRGPVATVIPLLDLGMLLTYIGGDRLDDAKVELERAVIAAGLQSKPLLKATAIGGLGRCLRQQGEIDLAIKSFQEALKLYRSDDELKRDPRRFIVEFGLAESHFAAGDVDRAFELAAEIEQLAHDGAPAELLVDSVFFQGWLYYELGIYETAAVWFERSTDLAEKHFGKQHVEFASCGYRALSLEASDRSEEAVSQFERILPLTTAGVDRPFATVEMHWGHGVALSATVVDDAAAQLDATLTVAQKGHHEVDRRNWTWKEPAFYLLIAKAHRRRNQPLAAVKALKSGLKKAVEPHATFRSSQYNVPTTRAALELMLANVYVQENRPADALLVLEESVQIRAKNLKDGHIQIALAQLRLGEFLVSQSDYQSAEQPLKNAYEQLMPHSQTVDPLRRRAATKLVKVYRANNRPDETEKWQAELDTLDPHSEELETD